MTASAAPPSRQVKALVIRAPWAFEVAEGTKTQEFRSKRTNWRGPVLISAAKRPESGTYAGMGICVVWVKDCIERGPKDFAWVLHRLIVIDPPVPVAGQLGLFDVDYELPDEWWEET